QRDTAIARYREQLNPEALISDLCAVCDHVLQELARIFPLPAGSALVAVGGYGRGELYPYSDVDVLILLSSEPDSAVVSALQDFVAAMWDLGLDPSHSVRTIEQCRQLAAEDVITETALLESRWLAGSNDGVQ